MYAGNENSSAERESQPLSPLILRSISLTGMYSCRDVKGVLRTFLSYSRGSNVASALGATNKLISCLLPADSTKMLHPHIAQPAAMQRPESHIIGVTDFELNSLGPSLVRAKHTE